MTDTGPIALREGDLVAGKYRVEGTIGVGGMGIVVAARHEQLDQRVAIKLVRGEVLRNPEAVQRFLREARAAAKLKSEHAARVLDVGTLESGAPYMVMEFLEGGDLAQVLEQRGAVPVDVAAEWVAQACEALAEAHAAGIIHRDLKPQNLFLARTVGGSAAVKVLDFGVSKSAEALTSGPAALTRTRSMLGSPLYMAPEQMRSSRDVDSRADVWALGVVLFELLTRRLPFEAETLPELCFKVVGEPPLSLAALRADVPEGMIRIVECCLEKDREKRFANAAELGAALGPLVPSGSRSLIERARWVAASLAGSALASRESGARPAPAAQQSESPARAGTPAAWGSKGGAKPSGGARVAVWLGAGVLALGGALVAALLMRSGGRAAASLPAPPGAPAATLSKSLHPPESSAANSVAVVALAPLQGSDPSASAPPASASAPPASASSNFHVSPPVSVAAPTPNRTSPTRPFTSAKPPPRDDDIPALR